MSNRAERGGGGGVKRERERERGGGENLNLNFILRMTVLGRGLIFQPVLLACTYNNDTIIPLQKKKSALQISVKV